MKDEFKGVGWYGWSGTVLHVDLTKQKITREPLARDVALKYLGGDGLGSKLLFDHIPAGTAPMDPKNPFILSHLMFPSMKVGLLKLPGAHEVLLA